MSAFGPDDSAEALNLCTVLERCTKGQTMSTGHCFCFNQTSVPRCKSRNDISCLQKKSLAYGWKVCALKTHVQTGEVDQTPRLGLMCVGWGENDNLMLEI